jgi:signal transduction histidine kinase
MWGVLGIRRALQNLVANAVKYGGPDSPIIISLKRLNEWAVLAVHNDGSAIATADQQGLFEAFQRTIESETGKKKGWGLGLTLVKGVADAHGGTVKVESAKDIGTTFTLDLPIRKSEEIDRKISLRRGTVHPTETEQSSKIS